MCVCRMVILSMSMCGWVMRVWIFTATGGLFPFEVAENHMSGCFAWGLLVPLHDRWLAVSETRSPRFCRMRNGGWRVSVFWWGARYARAASIFS